MRSLLSDPLFYSRRKPLVNIFSCCLALVGIFLCCPEYKFEHKFKSYGKSCSEQGFGQDKMSSVLINDCLIVAAVGVFLQSFIHTADIFSRLPEAVVICSDKDKLALNVLDLYHLFFGVLSCLFRVDKQFCAACYIARAPWFPLLLCDNIRGADKRRAYKQ